MAYQALYRLWRPQQFGDVVGQGHITKTLQNAILFGQVSHAYLFSGPRGTGKTSAAKIFAKAVNCEYAPAKEPCNKCTACVGITDGTISDVLEIDAASNNGVDEIREIRENVKYAPSSVPYKVYIIDEVHMLSTGAFNALLKTLEEPPAHVIFILATTEPHKVPPTIISRCQWFEFRKISNTDLVSRLQTVVAGQQVQVEEEALRILARTADGGMRDALSLLDQAISYSEETVGVDDVLAVTGSIAQQNLHGIAKAIAGANTHDAIEFVHQMIQEGKEPIRLVEDLIFYYRDMLLYQTAPQANDLLERVVVDETFIQLAQETKAEDIYQIIHQLSSTQREMKWSNHPQVFLEVVLVKLCQPVVSQTSAVDSSLVEKLQQLEYEMQMLKQQAVPATAQVTKPVERTPRSTQRNTLKVPTGRIHEVLKQAKRKDLEQIKSIWGELLAAIGRRSKAHEALLRGAEPVAASDASYVLAFEYAIHCKMVLDNTELITSLQGIMLELTRSTLQMIPVPAEEWTKIREQFLQNNVVNEEKQEVPKEDKIITEAIKLVGEDLVEIKE